MRITDPSVLLNQTVNTWLVIRNTWIDAAVTDRVWRRAEHGSSTDGRSFSRNVYKTQSSSLSPQHTQTPCSLRRGVCIASFKPPHSVCPRSLSFCVTQPLLQNVFYTYQYTHTHTHIYTHPALAGVSVP